MKKLANIAAALALVLLVGCASDTDTLPDDKLATSLRELFVTVDGSVPSTQGSVDTADPTLTGFEGRCPEQQLMRVSIDGAEHYYEYADGKFTSPQPAFFSKDKEEGLVVLHSFSKVANRQDGSAEALIREDELIYEAVHTKVEKLSNIVMTHTKSLLEINIKVAGVTKVENFSKNNLPYRVPGTDKYLLIIEPNTANVDLKITCGLLTYNLDIPKSDIVAETKEFSANTRYSIDIDLDKEQLGAQFITIERWGMNKESVSANSQAALYIIEKYVSKPSEFAVTFVGGETINVTLTKGRYFFDESHYGKTVRSIIKLGETTAKDILIGRKVLRGETIGFALDYRSDIVVPRYSYGKNLVGTFAELVLLGEKDTDTPKEIYQTADIDLMNIPFSPIGKSKNQTFYWKYDGRGYKIRNLYINRPTEDSIGLFHYAAVVTFGDGRRFSPEFKNIHIEGATIIGKDRVGGIIGLMGNGSILGCTFSGSVTSSQRAGGIAGYAALQSPNVVLECINYGVIKGISAGGIAGLLIGESRSCVNHGKIIGISKDNGDPGGPLGGITGQGTEINYCKNYGMIVAEARVAMVGGITGTGGNVYNNENHGEVIALHESRFIGGIVGFASATNFKFTPTDIRYNTNYANITGDGDVGGITSLANCIRIDMCDNYGEITSSAKGAPNIGGGFAENYCGGITAVIYGGTLVSCCTNYGSIKATAFKDAANYVGGISGGLNAGRSGYDAVIIQCTNKGDLASSAYIGGITAFSSERTFIISCASKEVEMEILPKADSEYMQLAGGIVGYVSDNAQVLASYSSSKPPTGVAITVKASSASVVVFNTIKIQFVS